MLYSKLLEKLNSLNTASISEERRTILLPLIDFIQAKVDAKQIINLNFICTHNSRRSHLSQAWAQATGSYFEIANLFCYSAGTEATALFPVAAKTLENSGFKVESLSQGENPIYSIKYR